MNIPSPTSSQATVATGQRPLIPSSITGASRRPSRINRMSAPWRSAWSRARSAASEPTAPKARRSRARGSSASRTITALARLPSSSDRTMPSSAIGSMSRPSKVRSTRSSSTSAAPAASRCSGPSSAPPPIAMRYGRGGNNASRCGSGAPPPTQEPSRASKRGRSSIRRRANAARAPRSLGAHP
jgi:hypothetical protein